MVMPNMCQVIGGLIHLFVKYVQVCVCVCVLGGYFNSSSEHKDLDLDMVKVSYTPLTPPRDLFVVWLTQDNGYYAI